MDNQGGFVCPPEVLEWERRVQGLVAEIVASNATVVGLQEVDAALFESHWRPLMSQHGYEGAFKVRTGKKDGVALFWSVSAVTPCKQAVHELEFYDANQAKMPQVAIAMPLRHNAHNFEFVAACTHLASQKDQEGEAMRKHQVMQLVPWVQTISHRQSGAVCPSVILADLNAHPNTTSKITEPLAYACLTGTWGFTSAYAKALGHEPDTTIKFRAKGSHKEGLAKNPSDYIFLSPLPAGWHGVRSVLSVPNQDALPATGIPSECYPSDHFLVAASVGC